VIAPPGQSHRVCAYAAGAVKYSRAPGQGLEYPFQKFVAAGRRGAQRAMAADGFVREEPLIVTRQFGVEVIHSHSVPTPGGTTCTN
jgi:hypothetical protein